MELGLKDKKVLITGGSKGIGLACAKAFIAEGAKVALVSRSEENLRKAKEDLKTGYTIAADLTDAAAAAAMVDKVEKEFGPIDVLVNSAGAAKRTDADDLTPPAWRASLHPDERSSTSVRFAAPTWKTTSDEGSCRSDSSAP